MDTLQKLELEELEELEEIQAIETEEKGRFTIENLDQLNWALRKLSAIKAQRDDIESLADKEVERIEAWKEQEFSKLQRSTDFFNSLIAEYALKQRDADPKWKKVSTPYGVVRWKKQQPEYTYNEEKLVETLETNGFDELVAVKKSPKKAELKKRFARIGESLVDEETGQLIEGVTVVDRPDKLDIESL